MSKAGGGSKTSGATLGSTRGAPRVLTRSASTRQTVMIQSRSPGVSPPPATQQGAAGVQQQAAGGGQEALTGAFSQQAALSTEQQEMLYGESRSGHFGEATQSPDEAGLLEEADLLARQQQQTQWGQQRQSEQTQSQSLGQAAIDMPRGLVAGGKAVTAKLPLRPPVLTATQARNLQETGDQQSVGRLPDIRESPEFQQGMRSPGDVSAHSHARAGLCCRWWRSGA
jgi:hypothetical protein